MRVTLWVGLLGVLAVAAGRAPAGDKNVAPKAGRPHLVMVISEDEYRTHETLPRFAEKELKQDFRVTLVLGDKKDPSNLVGIEALKDADVALFSVRRRTPPRAQLDVIRKFVADGKPLVAIRTSSHGFARFPGKPLAPGRAEWPEFDRDVLGGHYTGHYGHRPGTPPTRVRVVADAVRHPVLTGLPREEFTVASWLYKTSPLSGPAIPLMTGHVEGLAKAEPVAWTHRSPRGGRVFYTSLGHPDDFRVAAFVRLLRNGIYWASGRPVPARALNP